MGAAWYVVETKPSHWVLAERELRRQHFIIFNPKVYERRPVGRSRLFRERRSLYIPGYIFVRFDVDVERWQAINYTPGVKSLMMFGSGERAIPVRDAVVELLMDRCERFDNVDGAEDWRVRRREADSMLFRIGQKLRVLEGPFAGHPATVELTSKTKVGILIAIFGRATPLSVDAADWSRMLEEV